MLFFLFGTKIIYTIMLVRICRLNLCFLFAEQSNISHSICASCFMLTVEIFTVKPLDVDYDAEDEDDPSEF